jgi:hypothetical protein
MHSLWPFEPAAERSLRLGAEIVHVLQNQGSRYGSQFERAGRMCPHDRFHEVWGAEADGQFSGAKGAFQKDVGTRPEDDIPVSATVETRVDTIYF